MELESYNLNLQTAPQETELFELSFKSDLNSNFRFCDFSFHTPIISLLGLQANIINSGKKIFFIKNSNYFHHNLDEKKNLFLINNYN